MSALFETSALLAQLPGIAHGFFGRNGGRSEAPFASNNMSLTVGDTSDAVAANRRHAAAALGAAPPALRMVRQTHSSRVRVLTERPDGDGLVEADAMVTHLTGLTLGILTADCTPILLADPGAGVIGAAHAGWRGAVDGIIGNTVAAMMAQGAEPGRIVAAYGPTITAPNYEVGEQFRADFLALHPDGAKFFATPPGGKPHFDLPAFVRDQLKQAGVERLDHAGACTYANPDRYFSHRYATHRGERTGRQIALIGLR